MLIATAQIGAAGMQVSPVFFAAPVIVVFHSNPKPYRKYKIRQNRKDGSKR